MAEEVGSGAPARVRGLPRSALVICTKDRPIELSRCLASVAGEAVRPEVIMVIDAGTTDAAAEACTAAAPGVGQLRHIRHPPGLTAQRNAAVRALSDEDVEVVHFLDDDTVVLPGYFEAILERFATDLEHAIGGVGPVVLVAQPPLGGSGVFRLLKRFFLLEGQPGRVLRSGRNTVVWDTSEERSVQWLVGAGMSFRTEVFGRERFDERLEGYSWGEDFDFGFRVSAHWKLVVTPAARVRHEHSPINRAAVRPYARRRTVLLHRWVVENRPRGMRRRAFWWSVVGEVALAAARGLIYRDPTGPEQAIGVLQGALDVVGRVRRGATTAP